MRRRWHPRPTGSARSCGPVLFLMAAGLGCDPADPGAPAVSLPEGAPWEVESEPALSVGVVEGDPTQELHRVVTPFIMPRRGLVVPESGTNVIRVFDDSGRLVEELGGTGEGPGEFVRLAGAWSHGDTIEAADWRLQRITRFFPDGSKAVVRLVGHPRSVDAVIPGRLPEGWAAFAIVEAGLGQRDGMAVYRFDSSGSYQGEVARTPGMERFAAPGLSGPDPLSPRAVFAVAGGEIVVAETLEPRVRVFRADGALDRELEWDPGALPSPDEALGRVMELAPARAEPGDAPMVRQRLQAFPLRDRVSAFWDLLVDDRGFIWVRPYEVEVHSMALGGSPAGGPGPGGEWLILSRDGEAVHTIEIPADLELRWVSDEWVVGIHRDAFHVESVRVHAIRRQGR